MSPNLAGQPHGLDLGVAARVGFASAYLLAQAGIVALGLRTPDRVFAFQMFNESSAIAIHLGREVRDADGAPRIVRTDGTWEAVDERGVRRAHRWADRVPSGVLGTLDRPVAASYGVDAQLFRLQRALDDVILHLGDDHDTVALVANVDVWRNGRGPSHVRLESRR